MSADGAAPGPALTGPVAVGTRTAPSRVLFGPHVTNLAEPARPGSISGRHVAYYARRAAGGAGLLVTEVASVHDSDRPHERAPRAADCARGWTAVGDACRPHGTLVVAGLGHAGSQGSSAYARDGTPGGPLWAPSAQPDPVSREVPWAMDDAAIAALVDGFGAAAARAADAGLDGVEVQAGQHALLRQFLSPLTNHRTDAYGTDRSRLLGEVCAAVRAAVGDLVVGLRLAVDELAPWAGLLPDDVVVPAGVDYVVGVRGSGLSVAATRPDAHTPPGYGAPLAAALRAAPGEHLVVLAGGVVDVDVAALAVATGEADLVEMTRAQIADPSLVSRVRAGRVPRPCVLTNQECRARDVRNPLVSCTVSPVEESVGRASSPAGGLSAGALATGPAGVPMAGPAGARMAGPAGAPVAGPAGVSAVGPVGSSTVGRQADVLVVGGGPAGLEGATVLARAGLRVVLAERDAELGGALRWAARLPGRERFALLVDWWRAELQDLGVEVRTGVEVSETGGLVPGAPADAPVLWATGALDAVPRWPGPTAAAFLAGADLPSGPVVVHDPLGGPVGVGLAELLAASGRTTALVTPDAVAGKELARAGDLVAANTRLKRAGVERVLRSEPGTWTRADGPPQTRTTADELPGDGRPDTRAAGDGPPGDEAPREGSPSAGSVRGVGRLTVRDVVTGLRRDLPCAAVVDCSARRPGRVPDARPGFVVAAGDVVTPRTVHEAVLEGRRGADRILEHRDRGRGRATGTEHDGAEHDGAEHDGAEHDGAEHGRARHDLRRGDRVLGTRS